MDNCQSHAATASRATTWHGHAPSSSSSVQSKCGSYNLFITWLPPIDLLLLLSHFSRVQLCTTPSLGFSRQEHWSGLPFPSPVHKSEKWKWSRSVMSNSSRPHGLQPTRLLHPWDFPGKSTGVGCHCLLRPIDLTCNNREIFRLTTKFPFRKAKGHTFIQSLVQVYTIST